MSDTIRYYIHPRDLKAQTLTPEELCFVNDFVSVRNSQLKTKFRNNLLFAVLISSVFLRSFTTTNFDLMSMHVPFYIICSIMVIGLLSIAIYSLTQLLPSAEKCVVQKGILSEKQECTTRHNRKIKRRYFFYVLFPENNTYIKTMCTKEEFLFAEPNDTILVIKAHNKAFGYVAKHYKTEPPCNK